MAQTVKKRKNDIILVAAIGLVAILLWLGIHLSQKEGAYVNVTINGAEFGKYPLDTDTEIRIGDGSTYNVLVIKDGEAEVAEASCPDKLCVHQGKVHYNGQSIICLPNKAVFEIVGGEKSKVDAVVK